MTPKKHVWQFIPAPKRSLLELSAKGTHFTTEIVNANATFGLYLSDFEHVQQTALSAQISFGSLASHFKLHLKPSSLRNHFVCCCRATVNFLAILVLIVRVNSAYYRPRLPTETCWVSLSLFVIYPQICSTPPTPFCLSTLHSILCY